MLQNLNITLKLKNNKIKYKVFVEIYFKYEISMLTLKSELS